MEECLDDFYTQQLLVLTKEGYLMGDESVCLDSPNAANQNEASLRFQACAELDRQKWRHDGAEGGGAGALVHVDSGKCLTRTEGAGTSDAVALRPCR